MRLLLVITMLFPLAACGTKTQVKSEKSNYDSSFNEVWGQVASDELKILPQVEVSFFKLFSLKEDTFLKDAQRTLDNHSDILPPFEKLAHPNGICFKGIWDIDTQNVYSGYFKKNSQGLIIVRASSAMSNTRSGATRAFGFAGKLFPTTDPERINSEYSANFFLIDDLGGTDAKHYTDVQQTNEPSLSITFEAVKNLLYVLKVSHTFSRVDENPGIRQLYEISELGESEHIITPKWMKIEARDRTNVDAKDFRDELKIKDGIACVRSTSLHSALDTIYALH